MAKATRPVPDEGHASTDNLEEFDRVLGVLHTERAERKQRRKRVWIAFLLAGLIGGTVWAYGFSDLTVTQTIQSPDAAPVLMVPPVPGAPGSQITEGVIILETFQYDFSGSFGSVPNDLSLWRIEPVAGGGPYSLDVFLEVLPTGWETLQVEFRLKEVATAAQCNGDDAEGAEEFGTNDTAADGTSASWGTQPKLLMPIVDGNTTYPDAQVTFTGLQGGTLYCLGISDTGGNANNTSGTFMKRPNNRTVPQSPQFIPYIVE